jgi:hypothetical protein
MMITNREKPILPVCEPRQLQPKNMQLQAANTTIVNNKQLSLHGRSRGRPKGLSINQKRQLSAQKGYLTRLRIFATTI